MSGECDKCGEHALECDCRWFGATLPLNGPVIGTDGTTFDDYTLEEHLYYLFGIKPQKNEEFGTPPSDRE